MSSPPNGESRQNITFGNGKRIAKARRFRLTMRTRNSHPLHFDEVYCRERSFTKTRIVEGGLVFAWTASLASRDTTANALWEIGYDKGSHPNPVLAGDTLYAASLVMKMQHHDDRTGIVKFKLVGVKNTRPATLFCRGRGFIHRQVPAQGVRDRAKGPAAETQCDQSPLDQFHSLITCLFRFVELPEHYGSPVVPP